jgi:hypothetical protein
MLTTSSQNILDLIGAVMIQCDTLDSSTYYNMQIASNIFYQLGTWGLFSVVIYVLNSLLRTHRDGSKMLFKGIPLAIVAAMFVITAGYVGLASYNTWTQIDGGYYAWGPGLYGHQAKLQLARSILYLLGLIASGVLSMMSIFAMRSRGLPGGVSSSSSPSILYISANDFSGSHRLGDRPLHLHDDMDDNIRRLRCSILQL